MYTIVATTYYVLLLPRIHYRSYLIVLIYVIWRQVRWALKSPLRSIHEFGHQLCHHLLEYFIGTILVTTYIKWVQSSSTMKGLIIKNGSGQIFYIWASVSKSLVRADLLWRAKSNGKNQVAKFELVSFQKPKMIHTWVPCFWIFIFSLRFFFSTGSTTHQINYLLASSLRISYEMDAAYLCLLQNLERKQLSFFGGNKRTLKKNEGNDKLS